MDQPIAGSLGPKGKLGSIETSAITPDTISPGLDEAVEIRMMAVLGASRHHGVELDRNQYRALSGEDVPSPASLVAWVREAGLSARALRLTWKQLFRVVSGVPGLPSPVVLLFKDGSAGTMVAADDSRNVVWISDPRTPGAENAVAVDELRLSQVWSGETLLIRRPRSAALETQPFSFGWLLRLTLKERPILRDIGIASITLSALTIVPPLLVMTVVDRVVVHRSMNTLVLLSVILAVATVYEALLGYARRELIQVVSTRVDVKLNLHVFGRLLDLPLDFFERSPAGETTYRISQIWKIRDFLTGKLMSTFLDMFTLVFLLPFLFWMDATLAWLVLVSSGLIALVILLFLPSLRRVFAAQSAAESAKGSFMVETVHGMRTVKSLALEPQRRAGWDERVATASELRMRGGRLANWPQTIVAPIELFIQRGIILIGAYLALQDNTGVAVGGLVAFMLLSGRVAQPLVGLARLVEDLEDVRNSVGQVAVVLNNPSETGASSGGLRPRFEGAISFDEVRFTYPGSKTAALDGVSFDVPPGTMLGVVGRSGSGKSTVTRLLQGLNREYSGFLKIDGVELREINLPHLRRSFGVVLQDNFLFRGSIRENVTANRPGLTLEDVIRACRLAGAEEFIERMPAGYDTWIEEGAANLSGGQRQRLAIARAVIADPRLMILDEATSALDPESEALVNANLTRIGKGRTMVIVSHRLSSLVECHLIMVMDRGRVVDVAPHRTLLERCSIYRTLWNQQNRHVDAGNARAGTLVPVAAQAE